MPSRGRQRAALSFGLAAAAAAAGGAAPARPQRTRPGPSRRRAPTPASSTNARSAVGRRVRWPLDRHRRRIVGSRAAVRPPVCLRRGGVVRRKRTRSSGRTSNRSTVAISSKTHLRGPPALGGVAMPRGARAATSGARCNVSRCGSAAPGRLRGGVRCACGHSALATVQSHLAWADLSTALTE